LTKLYINLLTAEVVKPSASYALLTCLQYLSALSTVAGLKSIESIKVSLSTLIGNVGKSPSS